ncbi:hypothetical protein GQ43DRAFT_63358 [Delitschia confertaspora ATCC 74209]|uniref:Uncharacterized protein n=1 Tax=Delitschia confertaspora ATCC 74209 TaxID=1513339 RepID=A0A9P4MYA4_9PLEO|nr:hypothetical protein GQ43DRAFT_63358 [Delitschia confertaspora ATCC 74209]
MSLLFVTLTNYLGNPNQDPSIRWAHQGGLPGELPRNFTRRGTDPSAFNNSPFLPPRRLSHEALPLQYYDDDLPGSQQASHSSPIDAIFGPGHSTARPHRSSIVNMLDPRVDSSKLKEQTGSRKGSIRHGLV